MPPSSQSWCSLQYFLRYFPPYPRHCPEQYLPHVFLIRGRRLLYSHGIYALVGFTALLLSVFGGVTDRLIPLFAIGAFLAFTLSQAGMVMHWKRLGGGGQIGACGERHRRCRYRITLVWCWWRSSQRA